LLFRNALLIFALEHGVCCILLLSTCKTVQRGAAWRSGFPFSGVAGIVARHAHKHLKFHTTYVIMLTSNTNIIVAIGGKRLFSYKRLKLHQPINDHHRLELILDNDVAAPL